MPFASNYVCVVLCALYAKFDKRINHSKVRHECDMTAVRTLLSRFGGGGGDVIVVGIQRHFFFIHRSLASGMQKLMKTIKYVVYPEKTHEYIFSVNKNAGFFFSPRICRTNVKHSPHFHMLIISAQLITFENNKIIDG